MPGKNLIGLNADESKQYQVTVDDDGVMGNGLEQSIVLKNTIKGNTRSLFHLTNRIQADNTWEGIWEYMCVGVNLASNDDYTFRIGSLKPPRTSIQVEGNIIGGTSDSTRVAGAKFLLNAYTLGETDDYFQIGEAFNGFVHKDNDATYGDIFSDVEVFRTSNDYLGLRVVNGSGIAATGCTIFLRVLMSESV